MDTTTNNWPLKSVGLRVKDIEMLKTFYKDLGLKVIRDEKNENMERTIALGNDITEILILRELKNGHIRALDSAGLFHFALLLQNETELGSFLQYAIHNQIPLEGAADHLVSQSIYLRDPEGNGIEIYADRNNATWTWNENQIQMATFQLDAQKLLQKAKPFLILSENLILGHMHLNVGDLEETAVFYTSLGMDLTANLFDQAKFLSWNKYHHHLGINIWAGKGVRPVKDNAYGLDFFNIQNDSLKDGVLTDVNGINVINTKKN